MCLCSHKLVKVSVQLIANFGGNRDPEREMEKCCLGASVAGPFCCLNRFIDY